MNTSLLALLPFLLPGAPQEDFRPARVVVDALPVHSTFKDTTPVLLELPQGTPVRVVEELAPWLRVEVPGGLPLWVHEDYVTVGPDGMGTIPSSRVRARPLPSTAIESYPVGKFREGDRVAILGREGSWVRVRGPEHLAGWVKASGLRPVAPGASGWDDAWGSARKTLAAASAAPAGSPALAAAALPPAAGTQAAAPPKPGAIPAQPVTQPVTGTVPQAQAAAAQPKPAVPAAMPQPAAPGAAADPVPSAAAARPAPVAVPQPSVVNGSQQALIPPAEIDGRLAKAEGELAALGGGVFDIVRAQRLETELGALAWAAPEQAQQGRARSALATLAALRKAYDTEQVLAANQVRYQAQAQAAEAAARKKAEVRDAPPPPPATLEKYDAVGWLEYRSGAASGSQYFVAQGAERVAVSSASGRYHLKHFVGREVAVRGSWRTAGDGRRVLEISRLRVLPKP